jgi:hypothetical protein
LRVKENGLISLISQYMLDTHVDEVWREYLLMIARAQYFPPNPYPRFVSLLRQQAMRYASYCRKFLE